MEDAFPTWWILLTLAFVPVACWLYLKDRQRIRLTVREWAEANHVTLVKRLPAWYRVSPFLLKELAGGNQKIEYWLVRDAYGTEHRVWLKIGNFFLGATSEISDSWDS